ncbi:MAG: hypothetical protein BRC26_02195 [Nanohaloarchaea archaeon QH_8_44_6]|nr:MAG: hypothetical protein BRC26_02195 [Nanohaloarchaea archaeon QH_8_44_6]
MIGNTTLKEIGDKYNKKEAQIALRWLTQLENVCAVPKSSSKNHQKSNINIFDFKLDKDEIEKINSMADNKRKVDPEFSPDWD